MPKVESLPDVVAWRLCLGCGACVYHCPDHKASLVDIAAEGLRPFFASGGCADCTACLSICPGLGHTHSRSPQENELVMRTDSAFGPVLEIWEGHATDPEIRYAGSSGGALTALALFCLEREGMHGALHIGQHPTSPFRNETRLSRTRAELMQRTGSRYAPAAVCERLDLVDAAPSPCVVIGQPSEIVALRKLEAVRPALKAKVGLALSFFCAGSPSIKGTLDLIRERGVDPRSVESIRYRGRGWPGHFEVRTHGSETPAIQMTYRDSWKSIQAARPLSTHLWPDGSGEDADISCGDPWYQEPKPDDAGSSLIVVRTRRGRELLQRALAQGYLTATPAEPWKLEASQRNLTDKRAAIWGRLAALALARLPRPRFPGYGLGKAWLSAPMKIKLRSLIGTLRRAHTKGYKTPIQISSMETLDKYASK